MPISTGTATDHVDLYEKLIDFLTLGTTSDGPDWTLLRQSTDISTLLEAPGLSEAEEIHVGISLHSFPDIDSFSLGFWMFRAYNDLSADLEQPGMSGVRYLPVWDTAMDYWFIANGQRLIIVVKVSTTYQSGYVGKFLPYGTPGEYPQPYYMGMHSQTAETRFSSVDEDHRAFFDPGEGALLLNAAGQWYAVKNFTDTIAGEADVADSNYIWPFQTFDIDQSIKARYRELRNNVDGTYSLWPLILVGEDPQREIYGELDGAYAMPAFSAASEDTITIDSVEHLVVQNGHRTSRWHYAAIKME